MLWRTGGYRNAAIVLAAAVLSACALDPPVEEMSDARQAIAAAEQAEADRFARDAISEARRYLAQAEADLIAQAFGPARTKALHAKDRAVRALRESLEAAGQTSVD